MKDPYAFNTTVVTEPESEPISVAAAKTALGITDEGSDTFIGICIAGARKFTESVTQRKLITQTHYLYLLEWPSAGNPDIDPTDEGDFIQLPFGYIQSITSIEYRDMDGTWTEWADTNYVLDNGWSSGRVYSGYNVSWPTSILYVGKPIRIKFVCGYGDDGDDVPEDLISAMHLVIGELFNNRRFDPKDDDLFQTFISDAILHWM